MTSTHDPPIRVMVVDDHQMVREGLRAMLQDLPELEVVGEADDERSAIGLLQDVRPDVVLLDVNLRNYPSYGLCGALLRKHPDLSVIFMSAFEDRESVRRARRAGGSGFLMKGAGPAELLHAIRRARQGVFVLDRRLVGLAGAELEEPFRGDWPGADLGLAQRESAVLLGMLEGGSYREIAHRLDVSTSTVRADARSVMARLGVHQRAQAIRVALEKGIRSA